MGWYTRIGGWDTVNCFSTGSDSDGMQQAEQAFRGKFVERGMQDSGSRRQEKGEEGRGCERMIDLKTVLSGLGCEGGIATGEHGVRLGA